MGRSWGDKHAWFKSWTNLRCQLGHTLAVMILGESLNVFGFQMLQLGRKSQTTRSALAGLIYLLALLSYGGKGKPFLQPPAAATGKWEFYGR